MCDLKGARRERKDESGELDENDTVLDENIFRFNRGYPLLLSEGAKQRLARALWNDTLFLASINVMDYSLLIGMAPAANRDPNATNAAANASSSASAASSPGASCAASEGVVAGSECG